MLSIGSTSNSIRYTNSSGTLSELDFRGRSHATRTHIASAAPAEMRALLRRTVAPNIDVRSANATLSEFEMTQHGGRRILTEVSPGPVTPLVTIRTDRAIVAYQWVCEIERQDAPVLKIYLPKSTSDVGAWLDYILLQLAAIDGDVFGAAEDWMQSSEWATPEVARIVSTLRQIEAEKQAAEKMFSRRENVALADLESALTDALTGPSRMLLSDGDGLVASVLDVLLAIGFDAVEMDDHHDAKTGRKLEDMRIGLPSDPAWTCLAEIKGHQRREDERRASDHR